MATPKELARDYASQLRLAKAAIRKSTNHLTRTASAEAPITFQKGVESVLSEIDSLIFTETQQPVSEGYKLGIYQAVEGELKVKPGTLEMVKKGSIESLLEYQAALLHLYDQIEFV